MYDDDEILCRNCNQPLSQCVCEKPEPYDAGEEEEGEGANIFKRIIVGAAKGALNQGVKELDRMMGEVEGESKPEPEAPAKPPAAIPTDAIDLITCGKCGTAIPENKFADHYKECTGENGG